METLVIDSYNGKGIKEYFIRFNADHFYILQTELSDPSDFVGKLGERAIPPTELVQIISELEGVHKVTLSDEWKLEIARANLLNLIAKYNVSPNVDSYYVNGVRDWRHKDERISFEFSTRSRMNKGQATSPLWIGDIKFEIPCEMALVMLQNLEIYASDCFNATASHQVWARNATSFDDIIAYDYTQGYPPHLQFNINPDDI